MTYQQDSNFVADYLSLPDAWQDAVRRVVEALACELPDAAAGAELVRVMVAHPVGRTCKPTILVTLAEEPEVRRVANG